MWENGPSCGKPCEKILTVILVIMCRSQVDGVKGLVEITKNSGCSLAELRM